MTSIVDLNEMISWQQRELSRKVEKIAGVGAHGICLARQGAEQTLEALQDER